MSDRQLILDVLQRMDRRLGLNRALKEMAVVAGVATLVGVGAWLAAGTPSRRASLLALVLLVLSLFVLWSLFRSGSLGRAAAEADRRAGLHDELKTAHSFIREERTSPWIDLQIHYAARTAQGLDPKKVFPVTPPWKVLCVDGLLVAAGLFLVFSQGIDRDPWGPRSAAFPELDEKVRNLETLLAPVEEDRREDALQRLDETLRKVESGEMSLDEGLQELQETENSLTEAGLEAGALREELERVAGDIDGEGPLADVAEALRNQDLEEAAELLRELAERASGADLEDLSDRLELAASRSARMEEWLEAVRQAVEALREADAAGAEELLAAAEDEMQILNLKLEGQRRLGQAGAELEKLRGAMAVRRAAVQKIQPNEEEMAELAEILASLRLEESEAKIGGNPDGLPMGILGPSNEMEMPEPMPLDVQLEREMLGEKEYDPTEEEIRERPSRKQKSSLGYEAVADRSRYEEADVMHPESIPWRYRSLIEGYFRALRQVTKW